MPAKKAAAPARAAAKHAPALDERFEALYGVFPKEAEGQLTKGGRTFTYLAWQAVCDRLNRIFGFGGWSFEIMGVTYHSVGAEVTFVIAHGRLHYGEAFVDGMGGQKVNRSRTGEIVDLGDDAKGATMDALKKAAMLLGVGMYLGDKGGAVEAADTAADNGAAQAQAINEADEKAKQLGYQSSAEMRTIVGPLQERLKQLDDHHKKLIKDWAATNQIKWPPAKDHAAAYVVELNGYEGSGSASMFTEEGFADLDAAMDTP